MSIANTRPMKRRPTHPGEMLREDFLPDFGLTVAGLAEAGRLMHRSGYRWQTLSSHMARKNRHAPMFSGSSCTHTSGVPLGSGANAARSWLMGNG